MAKEERGERRQQEDAGRLICWRQCIMILTCSVMSVHIRNITADLRVSACRSPVDTKIPTTLWSLDVGGPAKSLSWVLF